LIEVDVQCQVMAGMKCRCRLQTRRSRRWAALDKSMVDELRRSEGAAGVSLTAFIKHLRSSIRELSCYNDRLLHDEYILIQNITGPMNCLGHW